MLRRHIDDHVDISGTEGEVEALEHPANAFGGLPDGLPTGRPPSFITPCTPLPVTKTLDMRTTLPSVKRRCGRVSQRAGMSLDEDERLRSDAEVECFLRSVAPGS
jgi:hypothetical protein